MDWLSVQRLNVMPITRMICLSLLAYFLLGGMVTAQSGLNSTESTSIAGSTSTDTLWADSTVFRWMMDNHNTFPTGQLVAAWPCSSTGCIPYADAANAQGVYAEKELPLGTQGSILQAGIEPSTAAGPVWTTYTLPMGTMCASGYFLASNGTNFICNATVSSANNALIWNWAQTSASQSAITFGESSPASGANDVEVAISTANTSKAIPLKITQGTGPSATGNAAPAALSVAGGAGGGPVGSNSAGNTGAPISLTTGSGSAGGTSTGAGGAGGGITETTGNGGTATSGTAGAGGGITETTGNGGATSSGTGGAGGSYSLTAGVGGNSTAGGAGGAGGTLSLTAGTGGTSASGQNTGAGGNIVLTPGAAGATLGTVAAPGNVQIAAPTVGGSRTTPFLSITGTWNTSGVVDAGILLTVTDTSSPGTSLLEDLKVASSSKWTVDKSGNGTLAGTATATNLVASSPTAHTVAVFEGSSTMNGVGPGTTGQILRATTTNDPQYIDFPDVKDYSACVDKNGTALSFWSTASANPAPTVRAGSNTVGCVMIFADGNSAYFDAQLSQDWDSASPPYVRLFLMSTDTTSGHTIIPTVAISCAKGDGTTTDDVAFNTAQNLSTITTNTTANQFWSTTIQLNSTSMTGCIASALMHVKVGRASDSNNNAEYYKMTITYPRLLVFQAN